MKVLKRAKKTATTKTKKTRDSPMKMLHGSNPNPKWLSCHLTLKKTMNSTKTQVTTTTRNSKSNVNHVSSTLKCKRNNAKPNKNINVPSINRRASFTYPPPLTHPQELEEDVNCVVPPSESRARIEDILEVL